MSTRILKTAALVVLTAMSALAFAQDETPSRVGRISMTQGQVSIGGEQGEETEAAVVNWPVTSRNQITTGAGSRTEIRIGSTAVRLDADSALDVTELEDDSLRLHLHYGSASVIVRNADALRGFELGTPEGIVRLQETGRMRIDAGRRQDTTSVSVFDGVATVDGGGSRLIVRAGKRAEITRDDVRTGLAMRDSFDEWAMLRDLRDERSESVRYVTSEMTGYEDLDQHGSWREDREYGPIWYPRHVSSNWVPYRDGRWTYLHPWGWTWVDNAPWGYAPFHYGRWVMIGSRWCWSPGRNITRVVWSPALVGWVGGSNWSVGFSSGGSRRSAPGTGWYPLSPRDTYTPNYRMRHDNLRYVNRPNGERRDDIRGREHRRDQHRHGLTIVPHDQFRQRATFNVAATPRAVVPVSSVAIAPSVAPPVPQGFVRGRDRDGDGRPDNRFGRNQGRENNNGPAQENGFQRRDGRDGREGDLLRRAQSSNMPTPAPALPPQLNTPPANQPRVQRDERNRVERIVDNDRSRIERNYEERERRPRNNEAFQQQAQQPQQQPRQVYPDQVPQQPRPSFQPQPRPSFQQQPQATMPQQQVFQQRSAPPPQQQAPAQVQPQPQPQRMVAPPSMPPPQVQRPAPAAREQQGTPGPHRMRDDQKER